MFLLKIWWKKNYCQSISVIYFQPVKIDIFSLDVIDLFIFALISFLFFLSGNVTSKHCNLLSTKSNSGLLKKIVSGEKEFDFELRTSSLQILAFDSIHSTKQMWINEGQIERNFPSCRETFLVYFSIYSTKQIWINEGLVKNNVRLLKNNRCLWFLIEFILSQLNSDCHPLSAFRVPAVQYWYLNKHIKYCRRAKRTYVDWMAQNFCQMPTWHWTLMLRLIGSEVCLLVKLMDFSDVFEANGA